ncbi:MAG: hypothetical protein ACI4CT_05330 [Lachnospiraceae bacterium]
MRCDFCEHTKSKKCGVINPIKTNRSLFYAKVADSRCLKKESGKHEN